MCVTTINNGQKYKMVVRELAEATGFVYPESAEEVNHAKREYEDVSLKSFLKRCSSSCFLTLNHYSTYNLYVENN